MRSVTPSFFSLLALRPHLGRTFATSESEPGGGAVAVVSHGFWQGRLGGDHGAVGRTITLDGENHTVVGVLPRQVGPLAQGRDVFTPLQLATPQRKGPFVYIALGRLRRDVERDAAAQELRVINDRIFPIWQDSWPQRDATWAMRDLKESVIGDVGNTLFIIAGGVLLVLLIACTNAANLLVARGIQRRHELAVRAALGASRGALLQPLLLEATLLATASALLGLALTFAGMRVAATLGADVIPRTSEIQFDAGVLLFFFGVTLASMILFGLTASLQSGAGESGQALRSAGRGGTAGVAALRVRRALVAAQFAVAVPLLVAATLLSITLTKLGRVDPGFDPEPVLTAAVYLPTLGYEGREQAGSFWTEAVDRIRAIPGVEAAGVADGRPPAEFGYGNNFVLEDRPLAEGEPQPSVPWVTATAEYFDALGVRLLEGRMFDRADDAAREVLVDRTWANRFFPGSSAVGRRFRFGGCTVEGCDWSTVIGVVQDVRYTGLDDPGAGTMYIDHDRFPGHGAYVVVRGSVDPLSLLPAVRRVIREIEPAAPITRVATGTELIRDSLTEPRYLTLLVAFFGGVALVLSLVGIYGVMAYFVQQHQRDIGIRLALGGTPADVARRVVANGMRLAVLGTMVGIAAALWLTGLLSSALFGVQATDPITFAAVAGLLVGAAFLACALPARRASRLDPMIALRVE